jgi:acyl carrier protein
VIEGPRRSDSAVTETDVLVEIRAIAATHLDLEREVQPDDDLTRDLELDSLRLITLAVAIEDRYRIEVAEEESARVRTVADLCQLVVRHVRAPS